MPRELLGRPRRGVLRRAAQRDGEGRVQRRGGDGGVCGQRQRHRLREPATCGTSCQRHDMLCMFRDRRKVLAGPCRCRERLRESRAGARVSVVRRKHNDGRCLERGGGGRRFRNRHRVAWPGVPCGRRRPSHIAPRRRRRHSHGAMQLCASARWRNFRGGAWADTSARGLSASRRWGSRGLREHPRAILGTAGQERTTAGQLPGHGAPTTCVGPMVQLQVQRCPSWCGIYHHHGAPGLGRRSRHHRLQQRAHPHIHSLGLVVRNAGALRVRPRFP
mmetsp:Transcript_40582/g.117316  ORF Transcript_40582/g.117316 Transcript_40582/m.117316 type:complete len:275 (+) Transcript_40582:623-1447(+)